MAQKASPQQVDTAVRRAFVIERRRAGDTYRQIAAAAVAHFGEDALPRGWSERFAHKDLMRELERMRAEMFEDAQAVRQMEAERLDELLRGLWTKAKRGDPAAVDRVLKIMERRAKLLGLDAASELNVSATLTWADVVAQAQPDGEDDDDPFA